MPHACAGIDDISILQHMPNIEVLSLSVNKIGSLRYFAFCSQLKQLYLRANAVHDLANVRYAETEAEAWQHDSTDHAGCSIFYAGAGC
jgi:hypothetical protein